MSDPIVVTLLIDDPAQARFDRERRELFPPGRTAVGAHVTLFHALPGSLIDAVEADLRAAAKGTGPFPLDVGEVMSLGRGAAYRMRSAELQRLHSALAGCWADALTAQDRQPFRPHVTVQNKVDPRAAAETVDRLRQGFVPFSVAATGLAWWRYLGGPWLSLGQVAFTGGDVGGAE